MLKSSAFIESTSLSLFALKVRMYRSLCECGKPVPCLFCIDVPVLYVFRFLLLRHTFLLCYCRNNSVENLWNQRMNKTDTII